MLIPSNPASVHQILKNHLGSKVGSSVTTPRWRPGAVGSRGPECRSAATQRCRGRRPQSVTEARRHPPDLKVPQIQKQITNCREALAHQSLLCLEQCLSRLCGSQDVRTSSKKEAALFKP